MDRAINQAAVELIDRLGGLSAVARAAGCSRQAVLKWKFHGFPPARVQSLREAFPKAPWRRLSKAVGRGRSPR
jgi:hypothetical protein